MRKFVVQLLSFVLVWLSGSFADQPALGAGKSYLVLGVIASAEPGQGIALLKTQPTGETFAARVGQKVDRDLILKRITRNLVYFETHGRIETVRVGEGTEDTASPVAQVSAPGRPLTMDPIANGIERSGNVVRISSDLREHLTKEQLGRVLVQAAALPYYENGALSGFKLLAIDAGSVYDKAGFKDGDIVTAVNGQQLTDVARTIQLLQGLKSANKAEIAFRRNGGEQSVKFEVSP